jgi:hypothetical protein
MGTFAEFIAETLEDYTVAENERIEIDRRHADAIGSFAANAALNLLGLDIPLNADVNQESLTKAINKAVLDSDTGFTNIFDKKAVQADVKRIALHRAAKEFGYDGAAGISELKRQIIRDVLKDVESQIEEGEGDFIDAAPDSDLSGAGDDVDAAGEWNVPRNFSDKAEKNRARQAAYRAAHKRIWVPK